MTFSRLWLILFALGIVPLLLSGLLPLGVAVAICWYLLLIGLALADWLLFPSLNSIFIERDVDEKLSLGTENTVRVRVRNETRFPLRMEVRDTPPEQVPNDLHDLPLAFTVPPNTRHAATYTLSPLARGDYDFGDLFVRVRGRLGMIQRQRQIQASQRVKVYPNMKEAQRFNLLARRGRLQQVGIRKARLQGAGREFESLRDYQPDDELRRIDWKATARRGDLVSRQYEVEKSQNVMLVLDVGRTMLAEVEGIQKIDYAINAALMLAYVAADTDDNVGLLVFADTVQTYLPPKKGRAQLHAILEALHNIQASLVEPDYLQALTFLQTRFRKRSLMVCFTDLWDPDSSHMTIAELARLQPRHMIAAVTLLDTKLKDAAEQEPATVTAVYKKAVAMQVLQDRQRALSALTQRGILVVDSPAEKLSADLVNKYLEVKERSKL